MRNIVLWFWISTQNCQFLSSYLDHLGMEKLGGELHEIREEKRKSHEKRATRIAASSVLAVSQPRSTQQMKTSNNKLQILLGINWTAKSRAVSGTLRTDREGLWHATLRSVACIIVQGWCLLLTHAGRQTLFIPSMIQEALECAVGQRKLAAVVEESPRESSKNSKAWEE